MKNPAPAKETKRVESEMSPLLEKNQIKRPKSVEPIPMNSLRATIAKPEIVIEYKEKKTPLGSKTKSVAKHPSPKKLFCQFS